MKRYHPRPQLTTCGIENPLQRDDGRGLHAGEPANLPIFDDPRSVRPREPQFIFATQPPSGQPGVHDSDDRTYSFCPCVKVSVAQETTDKVRRLKLTDSESHH